MCTTETPCVKLLYHVTSCDPYPTRFPNLGILHVTRKKVVDVLVERFTQQLLLQEKRSESAVTGEQPQLSDGVCS